MKLPPPPPDSPEFPEALKNNFDIGPGDAPGYWRNETGGNLAPAVENFLRDPTSLNIYEVTLIRAYIEQWINAPAWMKIARNAGEDSVRELLALREAARRIHSAAGIRNWMHMALDSGQDPF
jgi:hypothetical protein